MQGIEKDDPETSFRRGYEHGAIETFHAIERFLDPATRDVLRAWDPRKRYLRPGGCRRCSVIPDLAAENIGLTGSAAGVPVFP